MLTLAEFRAAYPEFNATGDALVSATLTSAALEIDASVWGTRTNRGHGELTAHYLASAPGGQAARLEKPEPSTSYWVNYNNLRNSVTTAIRVF